MRLLAPIAALLALSSPALAAGRSLVTIWTIDDREPAPDTRDIARGDFVFRQRLLPAGLAELGAGAGGVAGLAEGQQLIEIQSPGVLVFCDPVIRPQKLIGHAQTCLVDADRDGRFEGQFPTTSVTKGILTIQGKRPKAPRAIAPIAYRRLDPTEFDEALFVGLQYRGNANLVGNHIFEFRFGRAEQMGSLTERLAHKKGDVPGSKEVMGGLFTILAASPEGIRVRVDRPWPRQPFVVLQTTTYRIY